jgi:hypothetical protein
MGTIALEVSIGDDCFHLYYDPKEHYIEDVQLYSGITLVPIHPENYHVFNKKLGYCEPMKKVLADLAAEEFAKSENQDQWAEEQRMAEAEYRMER